ncbi:glycosyltransferase family 39 protein [Candidatus Gracilibacteria bacterium]|nr:glycosyltransferase family 39 protein [Candidatus Gracilibacteria bacterium]
MKFLKDKHTKIFLVIAVLAFAIRFANISWGIDPNIDHYSQMPDEPYSYESAFNIHPLQGQFDPGNWALLKGTFYYQTVGLLNDVKEIFISTNPELSPQQVYYNNVRFGRFISILFSIGTIFLIYLLSNLIFKNRKTGLVASAIYALITYEIHYSAVVGPDIMLTFLVMLTIYYSVKAQEKRKYILIAALCSGLATSTKFPGIIATLPVIASYFLLRTKTERFTNIGKNFLKNTAAFFAGLIIGMPSILFKSKELFAGIKSQIAYQTGINLPTEDQLPNIIYYFTNVFIHSTGILFTLAIIASTYYFIKKYRKQNQCKIILAFLIPYFISISFASSASEHYILPISPIIAIMIAVALVAIMQKREKIGIAVLTIFFAFNSLILYNFLELRGQTFVTEQFQAYEEQELKLSKKEAEIVFIHRWDDRVTYPIENNFANYTGKLSQIEKSPTVPIPSQYVLISDYNFKHYRRVGNENMITFLDRLENSDEFK